MEKAFWGTVAGCTLIFAILLIMYLNKSGVLNQAANADQTTQAETTISATEEADEITSLIQETQGNYATAMKALDENDQESAEQPEGSTGEKNDQTTTTVVSPNGNVDPNRNGNHNYFMDDPSATQTQTDSSSSASQTDDTPESKKTDLYQYDLYKDHVVITKYLGKGTDVVIPDTLDGPPVTELASSAFASSKTRVRVEIPDVVTTMGDSVFKSDAALVEVVMPSQLTALGQSAFDGCSNLTRLTIPDGVTKIGDKAFNKCINMTRITMPITGSSGITSVRIPPIMVSTSVKNKITTTTARSFQYHLFRL